MRFIPVIRALTLAVGLAACGPPAPSPDAGSADAGPPHIPCDVEALLQAKCRSCHGAPQTQGAPFPLLSQEDFLRPYAGSTVAGRAIGAVESDFMPLNGPPLPLPEKRVLLGWLDAGVPLSTANCN